MKGYVISAPLCLLICWILPVDSMPLNSSQVSNSAVPLSMVEDSVDDMYFGCHDEMMKLVKDKYFEKEKHISQFKYAWQGAEQCAKKKMKKRKDKALTKDHMQAICIYTADGVYNEFNNAVRTSRKSYNTPQFQFHSLHFLLSSAVQILNSKYSCHTTYRRTKTKFTGEVNQIIRFGSFASSSYKTNLKHFGNKTCFKIKTCSGAYLKNYSSYKTEEEVLIPPYEMFKITQKMKGRVNIHGLNDCETVYVLESAGVKSNMNCKIVKPSVR